MASVGFSCRNFAYLVGFNPWGHIRKPKVGFLVYLTLDGPLSNDLYINSRRFSDIAHALIEDNGIEDLPNNIKEAREYFQHKE